MVAVLLLPAGASAHVLDEYLQSTLVVISPADIRLQINLTPGVEIADKVLPHIDRDRDGTITPEEIAGYSDRLKTDLTARLDGQEVAWKLTDSRVPDLDELHGGHGILQLEFTLPTGPLAAGRHHFSLENRHLPALGAYLFNAARPKDGSIEIVRQRRNQNQSVGEIEFAVHGPTSGAATVVKSLATFVVFLTAALAILLWPPKNSMPIASTHTPH